MSTGNLLLTLAAVAVLAATSLGAWYWMEYRELASRPVFDPNTQIVPDDATSLEIEKALAALGFFSSPPYFDEDNVLQSLALSPSAPSAATTSASASPAPDDTVSDSAVVGNRSSAPVRAVFPFLSYRIYNQDKAAIRSSLVAYLEGAGWKMADSPAENTLIFFSATDQPLFVSLLEVTATNEVNAPALVVALSGQ